MKVAVLGSTGMLGSAVVREAVRRKVRTFGISRHSKEFPIDITDDRLLERTIHGLHPDVIINTAALVDLDACEKNPGEAYKINTRVVGTLSRISRDLNAFFIQISTDHYYTGDKTRKHKESDAVALVNEYARTKYAGEAFALVYRNALVVRTNILGFRDSGAKPTFVEWILDSLKKNAPMMLFSDYFISALHVRQLASVLFDCIPKGATGVYNIGCRDVYSKKDLIEALANRLSLSLANTKVGSSRMLKTARAESDGLDVSKAEAMLGYKLPGFEAVVSSIVAEYKQRKK